MDLRIYTEELRWFVRLGMPLTITYFFGFLPLEVSVAFRYGLRIFSLE